MNATNSKVIGLMGAVGSGKSTVAGMLRSLGASVHDADRAAHEALREPEAKAAALALLGPGILGPDGEADRKRIAERVFQDPAALKGLEAILHPRVRRRMEAWMAAERAQGAPALVLDIPLLAEAGLDTLCDLLLFVDTPAALRDARVQGDRGWTAEETARRQARQGALDAKRGRAHAVIENAGSLAETRVHVEAFWNQFVNGTVNQGGSR